VPCTTTSLLLRGCTYSTYIGPRDGPRSHPSRTCPIPGLDLLIRGPQRICDEAATVQSGNQGEGLVCDTGLAVRHGMNTRTYRQCPRACTIVQFIFGC
jgi:hypothetical protein